MNITFKHSLNLLDASDGYICEALMIELEKLKSCDIDVEVVIVDYTPGRPAEMPSRSNETGDPAEPEDWELEKDANDLAWEIIHALVKDLDGIPLQVVLRHSTEIMYNMREGLTKNIQNFIDQDLPDLISQYGSDE